MDGYHATPDGLTRFAALGQEQGTSLGDAGTALDRARLPGSAFGRSRAAAALTEAYERCLAGHVNLLGAAGSAVHETADAARSAADSYTDADASCAYRMGAMDPHRA